MRRGEYRGLCVRCAAELRERDLVRGIAGAPAALRALDRAEWQEQCREQERRRSS